MGLTSQSVGMSLLSDLKIDRSDGRRIIALAGNPNVGKSTVFNELTGMNQHTGNWPGKTVALAQGSTAFHGQEYTFVDLPGTYSLLSSSVEEEVARNFLCFSGADAAVVVTDATCLERNLNLVLQILEMIPKTVVCVNLLDEAKRKGISIDLAELSDLLGVPVVGACARSGKGLDTLMQAVEAVVEGDPPHPIPVTYSEPLEQACKLVCDAGVSRFFALRFLEGEDSVTASITRHTGIDPQRDNTLHTALNAAHSHLRDSGVSVQQCRDRIAGKLVELAQRLAMAVTSYRDQSAEHPRRRIDAVLTSKRWGIPIMLLFMAAIFWLTIAGANVPSELLSQGFGWLGGLFSSLLQSLGAPDWLHGMLYDGIYRTLTWVVAVMLPPMAIFFPLFTLLEDLGYLPRIAFNLDNYFKKACACGKQALTMCMGFGCNAAGVVGCRIIDSPRERLIAILTNNFVPCNGRFPTLIAVSTIFLGGMAAGIGGSLLSTLCVIAAVVFGILMTLIISRLLSRTILKGVPSFFTLELPPYRPPQIGKIIVRSLLDRTLFVLGRAVSVAAPAGLIIWLFANIQIGDMSLLAHCAAFLDPFARFIGLDGVILFAFILGLPANEIVVPIILMAYLAAGSLMDADHLMAMRELFLQNGWTWLTAVNVMIFSLLHFPCATTLLTIHKETGSVKWTFAAFLIPTLCGIVTCGLLTQIVRLFGLV